MSKITEGIMISSEFEAKRLWAGSMEAFWKGPEDIVTLCEAVDLGTRVVEILTVQLLQPERKKFPDTIASLLQPPPPEVEPERDFLHAPKWLRYIDVLDMLSAEELPCISPQLHHGWEDKVASCHRSREFARAVTGVSLDENSLEDLVLIGAYRNRIFRLPPPVWIVPADVKSAYQTLIDVVAQLFAAEEVRIPSNTNATEYAI